ncbi:methyl-accepting chemotaxis protein [Paracoccus sp. NSM]|uniref:methyl-accepting chemotaxis protein n=1 Tax=Paracoccus sp. NSM TaxID=3457784 RepID=UPI004037394D
MENSGMLSLRMPGRGLVGQAVDVLQANVMVANKRLRITYVNPSLRAFLRAAEAELRKDVPQFNVDKLIGTKIDIFHKDPARQRKMLAALRDRHRETIRLGCKSFDLHVTPIRSLWGIRGYVLEWSDADVRLDNYDMVEQMRAIGLRQGKIDFDLQGNVLGANETFLKVMGYSLPEILGKHHAIFVDPVEAQSQAYKDHWDRLRTGEAIQSEFRRVNKSGREVWIEGSYTPIRDEKGDLVKITKFCSDITDKTAFLDTIGRAINALADGDLEQRAPVLRMSPLFDKLSTDFNGALDRLQSTMQQIRDRSRNVRGRSQELRQSSDSLTGRTEQQARSIDQSAAALTQIASTVQQTTESTREARKLVGLVTENADNVSHVMQQTILAMKSLESSSGKIERIIGAIDEIAFQTNLLALNAGIEAARAGESGRGFAVVALEVRDLAQRSAEAAQEIKRLIGESASNVGESVSLVDQTGQAIGKMAQGISSIREIVVNIAEAAEEQAAGLAQIASSVDRLNEVTQQNSAMAQSATMITGDLDNDAARMDEILMKFRLGEGSSSSAPEPYVSTLPLKRVG